LAWPPGHAPDRCEMKQLLTREVLECCRTHDGVRN
jgi:hypothetical protein